MGKIAIENSQASTNSSSNIVKQQSLLSRQYRAKVANNLFKYFCLASGVILIVTLFSIIYFIAQTGFLTFNEVSITTFFFDPTWFPEEGQYGAFLFIFGTLSLTALTLLITTPISLGLAIFLAEVAPPSVVRVMRPVLDLLVGIPSVVYGYLGLTILVPLIRDLTGQPVADGLLAAALVLSIMVLPTITRISEDAINFVPKQYREAAYGLGATRLQMIFRVSVPAANKGILTAIILGMARALGETMAVVMVIGNTAQLPGNLFTPTSVLTSNIVMQIANVPFQSTWNYALYMMAFLLLAISLVLILAIRLIRPKGESA